MTLPPQNNAPVQGDEVAAIRLVHELQQALRRGDRANLVDCLRKLVAMRAPMGSQWHPLAHLAAKNGEISLARAAIDLFVEAARGDPVAQYEKAVLLEQCGALHDAYDLMCTLPDNIPDPAANAYSRGTAALFLGDHGEARRRLELATRRRPQLGTAWLSLAMTANLAQEADLADRIVAAESHMADVGGPLQAAYYYALGKVHAERDEHRRAFDAFSRGAAIMRSADPFDRQADLQEAEDSVLGYDAAAIEDLARRHPQDCARSIFVTGLPRSGTTLVEQILTSHSEISGGAEINRLSLLASEIGGISLPTVRQYVDRRTPAEVAKLWDHFLHERFPAPGRIVDKTINTTRMIGIAATLLPQAPLIWLTRDPLDRAWSCFRTFFVTSMPWSYDLAEIAFHFRLEDRLLQHWQEALGERLLIVPYEELVREPREWIPAILAHCGLHEEAQVYEPHARSRVVTTASVMQVRRPINRDAIGSSEPYRPFLQPFVEAYYD